MPPVKNVASELTATELGLLREAITEHAPDLTYLLTDTSHELSLDEGDRLVEAIAEKLTLGEDDALDERGRAFDDLIDKVNLGPYLR